MLGTGWIARIELPQSVGNLVVSLGQRTGARFRFRAERGAKSLPQSVTH
jgi:hypothetical protein